jgi:hypothetical protein
MIPMPSEPNKARQWWQFSVLQAVLVISLLASVSAWVAPGVRKQLRKNATLKAAIEELHNADGGIITDYGDRYEFKSREEFLWQFNGDRSPIPIREDEGPIITR